MTQKRYELDPIGLFAAIGLSIVTLGFIFQLYDSTVFNIGMVVVFGGVILILVVINSSSQNKISRIPKSERLKSDDPRYVSSEVRQAVWERDHGRCVICGSRRKLHYDHIIPFSKGGSNTEKNIRILCEKCNLHKSDKIE